MARPKIEDLQKHTLNLRAGDLAAIKALFPRQDPSVMVRRIVSKFVDKMSAVQEEPVAAPDLEL